MTGDEEFRLMAGLIVAQLEEAFPIPSNVDEEAIARGVGVEVTVHEVDAVYDAVRGSLPSRDVSYGRLPSGKPFYSALVSTLRWLRDEGMTRADGTFGTEDIVLTSMAKNALGTSSDTKGSVGLNMTEAAREIAAEGNRSRLITAVGEFLGSFVKGFAS